jgi:hypothetical protein
VRNSSEIERAITSFARVPNSGLILTVSALAIVHRELIIGLAARHKLPAIFYRRYFADSAGLVSYGYQVAEQFRGAADYVNRILKGEKSANLPVQVPTKYELVINPEDRQDTWPRNAAFAARPRRRGDRVGSCRPKLAADAQGRFWHTFTVVGQPGPRTALHSP